MPIHPGTGIRAIRLASAMSKDDSAKATGLNNLTRQYV